MVALRTRQLHYQVDLPPPITKPTSNSWTNLTDFGTNGTDYHYTEMRDDSQSEEEMDDSMGMDFMMILTFGRRRLWRV